MHSSGNTTGQARRRRSQAGFTLIEVACASFVLAVTVVGLAASLANGSRLSQVPREEMAARAAMRSVLAEISACSFPDAAATYQGRGFSVTGLNPVPGDADGLPGEIEFTYGPAGDTTFYTLTLRVRWQGADGVRSVESIHYLANVRGDAGTPTPLANLTTAAGGDVLAGT